MTAARGETFRLVEGAIRLLNGSPPPGETKGEWLLREAGARDAEREIRRKIKSAGYGKRPKDQRDPATFYERLMDTPWGQRALEFQLFAESLGRDIPYVSALQRAVLEALRFGAAAVSGSAELSPHTPPRSSSLLRIDVATL